MENLQYPIGKYAAPEKITATDIRQWIKDIQTLPTDLKKAVAKLSDEQLDTPYRPDGWTIRQVVHHVADSHANAYIRFKLAMTEENPTIRPYLEDRWAELTEAKTAPVGISINLITALHKRWVLFLKNISKKEFDKHTFFHPASQKVFSLAFTLGMYSWHGRHHLKQITDLIARKGW